MKIVLRAACALVIALGVSCMLAAYASTPAAKPKTPRLTDAQAEALGVLATHGNAKARALLQAAADNGQSIPQYYIGVFYDRGWGVKQDYAKAAFWYRKAAAQGSAGAESGLSALYADGRGVPQDSAKAAYWRHKAAEQKIAETEYNIGITFETGKTDAQNYTQAASWFRKAASRGYAKARYHLGTLYEHGRGVPQNHTMAYALFTLAAPSTPAAHHARAQLATKMTHEQIAQARSLAHEMAQPGNFDKAYAAHGGVGG